MTEFLTRLRRAPRRVLHRLRRQRALQTLHRRPRCAHLLVVCRGNLCRSPFAAALLSKALAPHGVRVDSLGLTAPGRPAPWEAVAAAAHHGVDLAAHRSQLVTRDRVRRADLIVVMDPRQRRDVCERFARPAQDVLILGDLDPDPAVSPTIRDPVRQPAAVFEQVYARIERCVRELATAIAAAA